MQKSKTDSTSDVFENTRYRGAATEKVKAFVLEEGRRKGRAEPWRLPPMRRLANHLGVSIATVQAAYRQLSKEGIIRTDPNRASYITPAPTKNSTRVYHIGVDFLKDTEDTNISWRGNLHGGILQEALSEGNRIVFHQVALEELTPRKLASGKLPHPIDGLILAVRDNIQVWHNKGMPIPTVQLFPHDISSTSGYVAADVFGAAYRAGQAFRAGKRSRVYAAFHSTSPDRIDFGWSQAGLAAGYHGDQEGASSVGALNLGDGNREEELILALMKSESPDAFFCRSDYTAIELLKIFKKHRIRVPEDVAVIGGTGLLLMNTEFFTMTRAFQPLAEIGGQLLKRLMSAIEEGRTTCDFPAVFLPCTFGGGSTTSAAENEVLQINT